MPLAVRVKPRDPAYYSALHIAAAPGTAALTEPSDDDAVLAFVNLASDAILAKAGAAPKPGSGRSPATGSSTS